MGGIAAARRISKPTRIGFLVARSRPATSDMEYYGGLLLGLKELGYMEGVDFVIEWRFADGHYERLPSLASDLVQQRVDVIVASGNPAVRAAQQATTSIPIVMGTVIDPVANGFAESLARPGGNITGLSNVTSDISPKHLELLLEIAPQRSRVGLLINPNNSGHASIEDSLSVAVRDRHVALVPVEATTPSEIERAFGQMTQENVQAAVVALDAFFIQQRSQIANLALKGGLPSVYANREHVQANGLMSYGQDFFDKFRRAANYIDRIVKGSAPGDLPIEMPTKFELVINLTTARALGLVVPQLLRLRAELIE